MRCHVLVFAVAAQFCDVEMLYQCSHQGQQRLGLNVRWMIGTHIQLISNPVRCPANFLPNGFGSVLLIVRLSALAQISKHDDADHPGVTSSDVRPLVTNIQCFVNDAIASHGVVVAELTKLGIVGGFCLMKQLGTVGAA